MHIGSRDLWARRDNVAEPYPAFDAKIALYDIIMLGVTGLIYFIFVFIAEYLIEKGSISKFFSSE